MPISATLAINETVERRLRSGLPTLALGFGEVGLPVHPDLRAALSGAAGENGYGPVTGIASLREAVAGYWARRGLPTDPDLVVVGPGSKPLLYALLQSIGGSVALPRPSWVSYAAQASLLHQRAVPVATATDQGGVPDPAALAAAARRARRRGRPLRSVVLTLPDNPTGTFAGSGQVARVCEVAREHDLLIISDEIYRDLVHDAARPFVSPAELAPERTIVTTGPSKMFAVGGWRIGVARLPHDDGGRRLHGLVAEAASEIWSSAALPAQHAAAYAFTEPGPLVQRVDVSRRVHAAVANAVADRFAAAGAEVPRPAGAFYVYPGFGPHRDHLAARWAVASDVDLARCLLDQHGVAVLPGSAFGDPPDELRLRVATSLLYGDTSEQRLDVLGSTRPAEMPWVRDRLDRLASALDALTGRRDVADDAMAIA